MTIKPTRVEAEYAYSVIKIGYILLPKFTGKSLFISGNLPITGNSKKAVNMNAAPVCKLEK